MSNLPVGREDSGSELVIKAAAAGLALCCTALAASILNNGGEMNVGPIRVKSNRPKKKKKKK